MNPVRGEIAVTLGGEEVTLRPTFEAFLEIESNLGMGVIELATRLVSRRFGIREAVAIIAAGAKAGGSKLTTAQIGEKVMADGIVGVMAPLTDFVGKALTGGSEKNAEAPAEESSV